MRFDSALLALLEIEGAYSKDPDDPGGETVFGISRRFHPEWPGWSVVEEIKRASSDVGTISLGCRHSPRLKTLVAAFYADTYWKQLRCEDLPIPIGEKLFETAVNTDESTAVKLLQIALAAMNHSEVIVDGHMGPKTLAAVKGEAPYHLYDSFQAAHGGFYVGRRNPKYERGWIRRALLNDDGPGAASGVPI